MSEPKPFASLSSNLLARKGQARPAMRPQMITTSSALEDLGWNDLGFEGFESAEPVTESADETVAEIKTVAQVQESIVEAFTPVSPLDRLVRSSAASTLARKPVKTPVGRAAAGAKSKAAFTLRLDSERHLKLRLACAVRHRSAQQIVTEALDQYLGTLPDVDLSAWQARSARN